MSDRSDFVHAKRSARTGDAIARDPLEQQLFRAPPVPKTGASQPPKIEKNVPLPPARTQRNRVHWDLFKQMTVGDSFALSVNVDDTSKQIASCLRARASAYALEHSDFWFAIRQEQSAVRIWRVPVADKKAGVGRKRSAPAKTGASK